jgi:hypothetical protein
VAITQTDLEFAQFVDWTLQALCFWEGVQAMAALATQRPYQATPESAVATRRSLGAVGLRFGSRRLSADERAWEAAKIESAKWGYAVGGAR